MKNPKSLFSILVLALCSLLLDACTYSFRVLPTPIPSSSPAPISILPTETPLPILPTTIPTATPTFTSIQNKTLGLLENFMTVTEDEDVRCVAFSPDGMTVAAAGGNADDFNVHLWDVTTGQLVGVLSGHIDIVWGLAFSPDGKLLASVSRDHQAIIYAWPEGEIVKVLDFPSEVVSVSFSPDGQTLAIGGVDKPQGQTGKAAIWTYAVASWDPLIKLPENINVVTMAYSPKGDVIVGGGASRNLQVWRTDSGASLFTLNHAHQVSKIAISPDGSTAATGTCIDYVGDTCSDGGIWLWNLSTGKLIQKLNGFPDIVEQLAFSVDGSLLIAGSRDGTLRIYTTSDDQSVFENVVPSGISAMALSADGRILITGDFNGNVRFWKNTP